MDANGDYIALVRYFNGGGVIQSVDLCRSTNGGTSWSNSSWEVDGVAVAPYHVGGMMRTASGTLLAYVTPTSTSTSCYIARSTDNGATWTARSFNNSSQGGNLEGAFAQMDDGTIVALVRKITGGPTYPTMQPGYWTKSTDDGLTWTALAVATNVPDMTSNCATIIVHDSTTVEVVYASRYSFEGTMYRSITTQAAIKNGDFGKPGVLFHGFPTKDFGYPASVVAPNGKVYLLWYDGPNTSGMTSIYMKVGTRP